MTPKNKKIAIGLSLTVIVAGISYLAYRRSINKKNSALLLEYISSLPVENSISVKNVVDKANVDTAQAITQNPSLSDALSGFKLKLICLNSKWYDLTKKDQAKKASDVAIKIAKGLNEAIGFAITDNDKFSFYFKQIQSFGAFTYVDTIYRAMYKKGLWETIQSSPELYKGSLRRDFNKWVSFGLTDLPAYEPPIPEQTKLWITMENKLKQVNKK